MPYATRQSSLAQNKKAKVICPEPSSLFCGKKLKRPRPTSCRKTSSGQTSEPTSVNEADAELKQGMKQPKRRRQLRELEDLPDHILVSVLEMVSVYDRIQLERVSRRWRRLCFASWSKMQILSHSQLIRDANILPSSNALSRHPKLSNGRAAFLLSRFGRHLKELDLSSWRDCLSYSVLSSVGAWCPRLTCLSVSGIQLTNSSLRSLGARCPNLQEVKFCRCFQETVVERGLAEFFLHSRLLENLDVSENERLSGATSFWNLPSTLKTLKMDGCFAVSDQALQAIGARCPKLATLNMTGCDFFTIAALNGAFCRLTRLRVLQWGDYYCTPEFAQLASLNDIARLSYVQELYLRENQLITDLVLQAVGRHCALLEVLDVSGATQVSDDGVRSLANCPRLSKLNLSFLYGISDAAVQTLARVGLLETLVLHRCEKVSDSSIRDLAQFCRPLKKLDVSSCYRITDLGVWALYRLVDKRQELLIREGLSQEEIRNKGLMTVWLGMTQATQPSGVTHPLLQLNFDDYFERLLGWGQTIFP